MENVVRVLSLKRTLLNIAVKQDTQLYQNQWTTNNLKMLNLAFFGVFLGGENPIFIPKIMVQIQKLCY